MDSGAEVPVLGQLVSATILDRDSGRQVAFPSLPAGWTATLSVRASENPPPRSPFRAFVIARDWESQSIEVSQSQFGVMPVSERMRPRYKAALVAAIEVIEADRVPVAASMADALSDLKGMFNRCVRRDQWDWCTVYHMLGEPPIGLCSKAAIAIGRLARAIRTGAAEEATALAEGLRSMEIKGLLKSAVAELNAFAPRLLKTSIPHQRPTRPEKSPRDNPPAATTTSYPYEKHRVANAEHARVLATLATHLKERGITVESNEHIDACATLRSGPALFEAKSIHEDNELSQIRHAIAQLYEYRYRHRLAASSLWIVLSRPPKQGWLVGYLEEDRDVRVLWANGDTITGPSAHLLDESGAAARLRLEKRPPSA